jgi:hypothetical protein
MKSIQVEESLLVDLKLLKGVLETKNMTETIRRIMKSAGYTEAFFEKMAQIMEARKE